MEARDSFTHYGLKNWGAFVRSEWVDGPPENAQGSSWHGQVVNPKDSNLPEPPAYIDEDSAKQFQDSMMACKKRDLETYWILAWFYRDKQKVDGLELARNRFWKWL
jgi:hypothetical protein